MDTDGGGWTVIQRRQDGSTSFQRTWKEYADGFGDLKNNIWLGNENIHRLTSNKKNELRIDLRDSNGKYIYAVYKIFKIGDAGSSYRLNVGNYNGTSGDMLEYLHNSMPFSTKDQDNDKYGGNCSIQYGGYGGWWFSNCDASNLNGIYGQKSGGIGWGQTSKPLKYATMMVRPIK